MATDRNDSLLTEILGELRGFGAVLGDIRDRLPVPAPADSGEPVVVSLREPQTPPAPADDAEPAPTASPRKAAARRTPMTARKTGVTS